MVHWWLMLSPVKLVTMSSPEELVLSAEFGNLELAHLWQFPNSVAECLVNLPYWLDGCKQQIQSWPGFWTLPVSNSPSWTTRSYSIKSWLFLYGSMHNLMLPCSLLTHVHPVFPECVLHLKAAFKSIADNHWYQCAPHISAEMARKYTVSWRTKEILGFTITANGHCFVSGFSLKMHNCTAPSFFKSEHFWLGAALQWQE